ncbi:hypothetical protein Moror_12180 [Moniliophthora roreri MCA 2997]|uniref:Uncharacterized protein n=1 Tax=Moniliophthora roreri (strain MCA 2997) TaxID=1381753 RepID=V2WQ89_MONRO|nr:hypothetical protein Moror_12180 [Moniliophthora roreri MCA 2997]
MPNQEHSDPQPAMDQFECDSDTDAYCMVNNESASPLLTPDENPNSLLLLLSTKLDTIITTFDAQQKMPNPLVVHLEAKVNGLEKQNRQWEIEARESRRECSRLANLLWNTQTELEEIKNKLEEAEAKETSFETELRKAREMIMELTSIQASLKSALEEETRINHKTRKERDVLVLTAQVEKVKAELTAELNVEKAKNVSLQTELSAITSEMYSWRNKYANSQKEKAMKEPVVLELSKGLASLRQSLTDDVAKLKARVESRGQSEVSNSMESHLKKECAEPEVRDRFFAPQNTPLNTHGAVRDLGDVVIHAMYLDILRRLSLQVGIRDDS